MALRVKEPGELERLKERYPEVFPRSQKFYGGLVLVVLLSTFVGGMAYLGFSFDKLLEGASRIGIIVGLMFPPSPGPLLSVYLKGLSETLAIAFLGTLVATIVAFPLGFLAAHNIVANRIVHFLSRRFLDGMRGVDTLIWALIFINVVGLGPFAGILAIAMSDVGSFGKLFSEAIEASETKPVEGVLSTGGSWPHAVRFAILPQVLPVILSQVLYYFESNARSATVIGIVGAGGIGLYLFNEISQQNWDRVAFLILLILATVTVIDLVSSRLRFSMIGKASIRRT